MRARTEQEALTFIQPVLDGLREGLSESLSCDLAGVNRDVLYDYKKKWESIATEIRRAKAEYLRIPHATVKKAAAEDWKPALEVLKRKNRKEWSEQTQVDITTQGDKINIINPVPRPTNERED